MSENNPEDSNLSSNPYSSGTLAIPAPIKPEEKDRPWGPWWSILWAFVVVCVWQLTQLILVAILAFRDSGKDGISEEGLVTFAENAMADGDSIGIVGFISAVVGVVMIVFIVRVKGISLADGLALRKFRKPWMWALLFPTWLAGMFVISIISNLFAQGNSTADQQGILTMVEGTEYLFLLFLGVSIGAPFFEEFLFRGLLHEGLRQSFLGRWGSGVVIAALFSVIHAQYQDPSAFVALFLLGILFTVVREVTGSLWAAVAIHFIQNTVVTVHMCMLLNGLIPEEYILEDMRGLVPEASVEESAEEGPRASEKTFSPEPESSL